MNKKNLKKIGIHTVANGYSQLVTIAIQLFQIPIFLKFWGPELYGEWLVLTGLPQILVLLDAGVSQVSATRATIAAGRGDYISVNRIIHTANAFAVSVGLFVVMIGLGASVFVDWSDLLDLNIITKNEAYVVVVFMTSYVALQLQGGLIDAVYRASDRASLGAFLLANRRVAELLFIIIVLYNEGGVKEIAISIVIVQFAMLLVIRYPVREICGKRTFSFKESSLSELRAIALPSFGYLGLTVAQIVSIQGGIQMLNQTADSLSIVMFTMVRTLTRIVIQLSVVLNNGLRPQISILAGKGLMEEAKKITNKISFYASIIGVCCYGLLVIVGPYLIHLWSGYEVLTSHSVVALVGSHAVVNVLWYVRFASQIATNNHSVYGICYSASAVLTLIAWFVLQREIEPILAGSLLLLLPELTMLTLARRKS